MLDKSTMVKIKKYIIANWKMNPVSLEQARRLLGDVAGRVEYKENIELVICPPHIFFGLAAEFPKLKFGAQNIFWEDKGAYTGEVSGLMVKNFSGQYTIVGHSERRKYLGETDAVINLKVQACLRNKLTPILCIGESEKGQEEQIKKQLYSVLPEVKKTQIKNILIVYEPMWAISVNSGGVAADSDDALAGLLFIRKLLVQMFGQNAVKAVKILYGGSVDSKNVSMFVNKVGFDGVLVGNASLDSKEFVRLINNV